MLGFMKYHAKSSKDPEKQEDAKTALLKYSNLDAVGKEAFLVQYEKHKGNLKWSRLWNRLLL